MYLFSLFAIEIKGTYENKGRKRGGVGEFHGLGVLGYRSHQGPRT
jgi:hypothetical protein